MALGRTISPSTLPPSKSSKPLQPSASDSFLSHPSPQARGLPRPRTAINSSFTNALRKGLRSEGFLAPGPPTDQIVKKKEEPKGITRDMLISMAQEKNMKNGKEANDGLEMFMPKPVIPPKSFTAAQEIIKKRGFRPVFRPSSSKKPQTLPLDSYPDKLDSAQPRLFETTKSSPCKKKEEETVTWSQFRAFMKAMQARVPRTAEMMNRRMILSKEANEIRAETMATVKICEKERKRLIARVPPETYNVSVCSRHSTQERSSFYKEAHRTLVTTLESKLVDKLAAAEIETIKQIEREAAYPKLSNEEIQVKLAKLKMSAEANFKPLEQVRSMEVIYLKHKNL